MVKFLLLLLKAIWVKLCRRQTLTHPATGGGVNDSFYHELLLPLSKRERATLKAVIRANAYIEGLETVTPNILERVQPYRAAVKAKDPKKAIAAIKRPFQEIEPRFN